MITDLIDVHAPAIDLQGLVKSFGDNEVLKGIDLTVTAGEVVCVIGPSGSGKSTLLRSVNLLEEPTGGKVLIEGIDITDPDVDIDRVRTRIGMVFQSFNLFPHLDVHGQPHDRAAAREEALEGRGREGRARDARAASVWRRRPTRIRGTCRAVSSSAWRSPGRCA